MNKLILVFCAVLAVANGLAYDLDIKNIENYLEKYNEEDQKIYLQSFFKNISRIAMEPVYKVILPALGNLYELTTDLIEKDVNITKYLHDQLDILEPYDTKCSDKYNTKIQNINETKSAMKICLQQYMNAISPQPMNYVKKMLMPYMGGFSSKVKKCEALVDQPYKYLVCMYPHHKALLVFVEIFEKKYITIVEKVLKGYDASKNNKIALECTKRVDDDLYSKISEVKTLLQNCMNGDDE